MKTRNLFVFYSLLFLIITGCSASRLAAKHDNIWIPPDFDPKNTILLLEKSYVMTSEEKEIENYMKNTYPYRFEFILAPSIKLKPGKYADTDLYRFGLLNTTRYRTTENNHSVPVQEFYFYDRKNNKEYPDAEKAYSNKKINNFKAVIESLLKYYLG